MDKKSLIKYLKSVKDRFGVDCPHEQFDRGVISEAISYIETDDGAEVPCSVGLFAQLKIATDALNMIGSGTEDLMPPYRAMGTSQMKDVAYKALTEINDIDEVSR